LSLYPTPSARAVNTYKLRLYSSTRLDRELYARVRGAGFIYAPKQELFVAPMWTPEREDLLIELCGEIDDEDTSLVERAGKWSPKPLLPGPFPPRHPSHGENTFQG
jgi:hypothetical protein